MQVCNKLFNQSFALPGSCAQNGSSLAARNDGSERIAALDILRGVAVLGILSLNIVSFGLPHAYADPSVYGGADGWNLVAFTINNLFFEGSMRGLFSLLFGASVVLLTCRTAEKDQGSEIADKYYRRMLWLFIFGVIHAWGLLWYGDVLYWYALAGLFLFPLRRLNSRLLIILGVLMIATLIPRSVYSLTDAVTTRSAAQAAQVVIDRGESPGPQQIQALEKWISIEHWAKPDAAILAQKISAMHGNYFSVLQELAPKIAAYQSTILYEGGFFDALGFMLLGMALLKAGVLTGQRSNRFYLVMIASGYGVGVPLNAYETYAMVKSDFDIIAIMTWGFLGIFYDLARIPVTLGHMALIILVCKVGWFTALTSQLAAVGRMALTHYVMQSVICGWIFYGFGLSLFGQLQRYQLYYIVFIIWCVQIVVSPLWLRHFYFGPLEWLWRSLTLWQRQALYKQKPTLVLPDTANNDANQTGAIKK